MCLFLAKLAALSGCSKSEKKLPHHSAVPLGPLARLTGAYTYFAVERVAVIQDAKGLAAVSTTCTHQSCQLVSSGNGFNCPCHGAKFDAAGSVVEGPAKLPLPWYRLSLDAHGDLFVHLAEVVSSDWRLNLP